MAEQDLTQLTALWNRPEILAEWRQVQAARASGDRGRASTVAQDFYRRHPELVLPHDYQVTENPDGSVGIEETGWFKRNADWLMPAAIGGVAGGVSLAGSGAGAAGASSSAAPTVAGLEASATPLGAGGIPGMAAGVGGGGSAAGGILGALGKYAPMIGDVSNVVSEAAGGAADGRRADSIANGRAIAENNAAKVAAARYNLDLPNTRASQVARGDVLNTMQDAPKTGDARIDKFSGGGLRPSAFGPQSRAAGAELSRQAMSGLMNPEQDRLTPQEIPQTSASLPERIAGGAGLAGNILSLLAKYGGQR